MLHLYPQESELRVLFNIIVRNNRYFEHPLITVRENCLSANANSRNYVLMGFFAKEVTDSYKKSSLADIALSFRIETLLKNKMMWRL